MVLFFTGYLNQQLLGGAFKLKHLKKDLSCIFKRVLVKSLIDNLQHSEWVHVWTQWMGCFFRVWVIQYNLLNALNYPIVILSLIQFHVALKRYQRGYYAPCNARREWWLFMLSYLECRYIFLASTPPSNNNTGLKLDVASCLTTW